MYRNATINYVKYLIYDIQSKYALKLFSSRDLFDIYILF
jgi:hypothetical protein